MLRLLLHYDQRHLRLWLRLGLQTHVCLLLQLTLRLHIRLLLLALLLLDLRLRRRLLAHVEPLAPRCSRSILPGCFLCHPAGVWTVSVLLAAGLLTILCYHC